MSTEVRMPRLTDTMIEAAVVAWRKQEGDPVRVGEILAEVEADKTTVDLEAREAGTLARILVPAGSEKVPVGAVLALMDRSEEEPAAAAGPAAAEPVAAAPTAPRRGNGHLAKSPDGATVPARSEAAPAPEIPRAEPAMVLAPDGAPAPEAATAPDPVSAWSEVAASPLARSMARQAGLDLSSLRGTGPGGRIVKADILAALGAESGPGPGIEGLPTTPAAATGVPPLPDGTPYDEVPHSRMRQVIARRLGEAKRTIPHFYLAVHCQVDTLLRLRAELQGCCEGGLKFSLNDFAIRAAAVALRRVPEANASWTESATRRYRRVDLAFAVATEDGLIAPVIRAADRKGLAELAAEVRDLAARARAGRLRPEEYQGGTFTVSNLGMYGVDEVVAIVNPPQAAILGLGAAGPRPVARDGSVAVATMMTCTLSADHRVLDGAAGARFLAAFRALIEQPLTMLV
jgi:pyruvate dehydrogenase E2 component (dihydrolipoamide acetyltransferase)